MASVNDYEKKRDNFKQTKLVIIEDNSDHVVFIQRALKQCLPEITPVFITQADEAIQRFSEWSQQEWELPKLIIQDLYMPTREDGWQLLRQIKQLSDTCSRIPVIMLSWSNQPNDIEEAYQYGVSSYLVKPTDFTGWLHYFSALRSYWWETVTLPPMHFSV
ncbi:response regulator [Spirosoma daeguense]